MALRLFTGSGRAIATLLLLAVAVLRTFDPAPIEALRLQVFDLYQLIAPRTDTSRAVLIAAVDEASLKAYGQWPWPRTLLAELVDVLARGGAKVIAFDVIFAERDRMSPKRLATTLEGATAASETGDLPDNDVIFAESLRRSRVVLGMGITNEQQVAAVEGPSQVPITTPSGVGPTKFVPQWPNLLPNLEVLQAAAAGSGIVGHSLDRHGATRHVPGLVRVGDALYPAFALEVLRIAADGPGYTVRTGHDGIDAIETGGATIPTDARGRIWIHFRYYDPDLYLSVADILQGRVAPAALAGKIVLVGATAVGLHDIYTTPFGPLPGVEVHAQLLDSVLTADVLRRPAGALSIELLATLVAGLLLIVLIPLVAPRLTLVVFCAVVAVLVVGSWLAFSWASVLMDFTLPVAASAIVFVYLLPRSYARLAAASR